VIPELERQLGELPDVNDNDALPQWIALLERHKMKIPKPTTLARILDFLISELIEPQCQQPTLILGHPKCMSPLSKDSDSQTTARFELFVLNKELVNAYVELNDPEIQRERFMNQMSDKSLGDGEAQNMDEQYCEALEYGLPPTVGWGIGIDRIAMLFSHTGQIRDVIAFPILKPEQ
jgi:lysyl-tRNA synthetase, class II